MALLSSRVSRISFSLYPLVTVIEAFSPTSCQQLFEPSLSFQHLFDPSLSCQHVVSNYSNNRYLVIKSSATILTIDISFYHHRSSLFFRWINGFKDVLASGICHANDLKRMTIGLRRVTLSGGMARIFDIMRWFSQLQIVSLSLKDDIYPNPSSWLPFSNS